MGKNILLGDVNGTRVGCNVDAPDDKRDGGTKQCRGHQSNKGILLQQAREQVQNNTWRLKINAGHKRQHNMPSLSFTVNSVRMDVGLR